MFNINKKENGPSGKMNEAIASVIGEDMNVVGHLSSNASIKIDGKVTGNISSEKLIIVGEKAEVKGDLKSKNVIVLGMLHGSVNAAEVQIKKSGVINGDISVQAIEIEMGGRYNGKLMMNAEQREMHERQKARELKPEAAVDAKSPESKTSELKLAEPKPAEPKPNEPKNGILIE
jgi:cytoskeletal protein CcmA (bactofilin family)